MSKLSRHAVDAHLRPSTTLAEPRDMATALLRHAQQSGYAKQLYVLPDQGRGDEVEQERIRAWWIAPDRQQPAYGCGKIIVTSRFGGAAVLFVGLCVQKGLDPQVEESLPAAQQHEWVMTAQPRWVWEDFLPEMAAGYIDPLAAQAEDSGACPLTVVLEARDPCGKAGYEIMAFGWSRGQIAPVSTPHRRARGYLRDFSSASTLATLAQRLRYAPHCRKLWIDLAIGFQLWVNRKGPGTVPWDESRIWASACRPWSLWLR